MDQIQQRTSLKPSASTELKPSTSTDPEIKMQLREIASQLQPETIETTQVITNAELLAKKFKKLEKLNLEQALTISALRRIVDEQEEKIVNLIQKNYELECALHDNQKHATTALTATRNALKALKQTAKQ